MRMLTPLLYPFAVIYDAATRIRNRLYDVGVKPSAKFEMPVISVGNLSVGGTGKTPMIEYLIRLFGDEFRIATLSRGYGRRTKGVRIAGEYDDAQTLGDEPFLFYRKFGHKAVVAVGEERAFAIPHIMDQNPETGLILLDDAFQHRKVQASFQILLTDYHHLFVNDFLLPAGRLRESRKGAARADVIVVTKCPSAINDDEMMSIEGAIRRYSNKVVFFSSICYGNILSATEASPYKPQKIVLVSGIANPGPLERHLRKNYDIAGHLSFRDHHLYSRHDMLRICQTARQAGAAVVTTEKDVVKLDPDVFQESGVSLYYLPIEVEFLKNGKEFDEMVLNAARTYRLRRGAGDSGEVSA
jgi:tetraacyldisaccharide 4'-kinase